MVTLNPAVLALLGSATAFDRTRATVHTAGRHITRLTLAVAVALATTTATFTVSPSASAWESLGCVRATDMHPATRNLDVYVAFLPGGHPLPHYYSSIGIDAANAWYGAVHNVILWSSPDWRSQVAVRAHNFGNVNFAGIASKGAAASTWYRCAGNTPMEDDTWAQWNTYYTNGYPDNLNRAIMVHELGHVMGLSHEDDAGACGAVMHTNLVGNFSACRDWAPRWDDVYGIQDLYPGRALP